MVVAGKCPDNNFCGSKDPIFAELYTISTRIPDWTKYITHLTDSNFETLEVQAIKFGPSLIGVYLGVILKSNYKPMIALLTVTTGAFLRGYYFTDSFYSSSSV